MLKNYFIKNWQQLTGEPTPPVLTLVPLTSCRYTYGNDLILIFTNKNFPDYIFKICRSKQYGFKLRREYSVLQALNSIQGLEGIIPAPHYIGVYENRTFFLIEGIPGINLSKLIEEKGLNANVTSLIKQSVNLLCTINLAHHNLGSLRPIQEDFELNFLLDFENIYLQNNLPENELSRLQHVFESVQKRSFRLFKHGDYWASNIIVDPTENKIRGIIDWEFASTKSSIPTDIIWFLLTFAQSLLRRKKNPCSLKDACIWAFWGNGIHTEFLADLYSQYIELLPNIGVSFVDLLKITLAEFSVRELSTYGKSTNMDKECIKTLEYIILNAHSISQHFRKS